MKKNRIAALLLAVVLVASAFAGCGETKAQTSDKTPQKQDQQQPRANSRGTMAKVVSLDGDQLTVMLADMPDGGVQPAAGTPPAIGAEPASGTPPAIGVKPENGGGAPAGQPGQSGQPGQGGGKIEFTGGNVTYTLSSDVKIIKETGSGSSEIDLSELAADDVITFTTATGDGGSEVIDSIRVIDSVN